MHVIVGTGLVYYFAPIGLRSIVMTMSVCRCVCLSVRWHNSKTTRPNFTTFLCMLPVAMARSSSDGVAIRYVLPVLRMTACSHTVGWWDQWAESRTHDIGLMLSWSSRSKLNVKTRLKNHTRSSWWWKKTYRLNAAFRWQCWLLHVYFLRYYYTFQNRRVGNNKSNHAKRKRIVFQRLMAN